MGKEGEARLENKPIARVVTDPGDFDPASGSPLERILFNHRPIILILCAIVTVFLAFEASKVRLSDDYLQTIPDHQPYIVNYLKHFKALTAQSNAVQIAVVANQGTILNAHYLEMLKEINDQVYLLPGVNRPWMESLWTPNQMWVHYTQTGMDYGTIMDQYYDGSPKALQAVAMHIKYADTIGVLVEPNFKSSLLYVPLVLSSEEPINYGLLARQLNQIAKKYDSQGITLHMIGFGLVVGDMINSIGEILGFFLISIIITTFILLWYTQCVRSALLVVAASLTAVIWQMGLLVLLGLQLTPYSVLVPFLVFAIGMSHGAQKMNGVMQDIGRGNDKLIAARYTFRRLFLAGFVALICDAASFAVLMVIRIGAIEQLAIIATIGVALLVITNLILIPIMLSYIGVNAQAAARSVSTSGNTQRKRKPVLAFLDLFTRCSVAAATILAVLILTVFGVNVGRHVQIGDLQPGAPELRQTSQYNKDNAYFSAHYISGRDKLVVFVDTVSEHCLDYPALYVMSKLQWQLQQMPQVMLTESVASIEPYLSESNWEGSPKWYVLQPNRKVLYDLYHGAPPRLENFACNLDPIYVSLIDHKAATLSAVVSATQNFIDNPENQDADFKMSLLGGDAGIEAATNIVVAQANAIMLALVYLVVILFCFIAFRSWRAVLCAIIPLAVTSVLAQALMVWLHIGVKVATLPVLALGVGIGVDYALYVLSIMLRFLRAGLPLSQAYHETLMSTGKVVLLTGITLAIGVGTWIFAPIKFQADMGLVLAFMFLWNMLGAMILLPALASFLLPARLFRQ